VALPSAPVTLVVSDVYGPVVQGDGPRTGRRCSVIRLGGCNLSCGWCDSTQTWDGGRYDLSAELTERLVRNVVVEALAPRPGLVVVTGGEPLLQQRREGWALLLDGLSGVETELETNGTLPPTEQTLAAITHFLVSPKLAHAGDPAWMRIRSDVLRGWGAVAAQGGADFSFVVRDLSDVSTVAALAELHELPTDRVWIVPEGRVGSHVREGVRQLAEIVLESGFNLSTRLMVSLWGAAMKPDGQGRTEAGALPATGPVPLPDPGLSGLARRFVTRR
jgi:organic radical activating enzyme